jgi:hypothetical protein
LARSPQIDCEQPTTTARRLAPPQPHPHVGCPLRPPGQSQRRTRSGSHLPLPNLHQLRITAFTPAVLAGFQPPTPPPLTPPLPVPPGPSLRSVSKHLSTPRPASARPCPAASRPPSWRPSSRHARSNLRSIRDGEFRRNANAQKPPEIALPRYRRVAFPVIGFRTVVTANVSASV